MENERRADQYSEPEEIVTDPNVVIDLFVTLTRGSNGNTIRNNATNDFIDPFADINLNFAQVTTISVEEL